MSNLYSNIPRNTTILDALRVQNTISVGQISSLRAGQGDFFGRPTIIFQACSGANVHSKRRRNRNTRGPILTNYANFNYRTISQLTMRLQMYLVQTDRTHNTKTSCSPESTNGQTDNSVLFRPNCRTNN